MSAIPTRLTEFDDAYWDRCAKEQWYEVRDARGRNDRRAHKIRSFNVPHGQIETLCGESAICSFPMLHTTSDPAQVRRRVYIRCRRCEAEILSGRFQYPE